MGEGAGHFCGGVDLGLNQAQPGGARLDIFFRGYLSNLPDLARRLSLPRTSECSAIDVIAKLFELQGLGLSTQLDGQFALAVADRRAGEVLLSHDPMGVVPLYWTLKAGRLRFATRIGDLVDDQVRSSINLTEVRRYLLDGGPGFSATVYKPVNRLEVGTSVWATNASVSRHTIWDPRRTEPIVHARPERYVEQFRDLVGKAVRGALHGRGSAWLGLSGGLDSNTLLPPALECCPGLKAFSVISPQWPDADESRWIRRIVERRGLDWHPINAEDVLPFGEIPRQFCGAPDSAVIHQRVNTALAGLIGTDVQLTGNGGDSFMGAKMGPTPSHLADSLLKGKPVVAWRDLRRWMRESRPHRPAAYWIYQGLVLPTLRHGLRRSVRPPHYHTHPPWLICGRRWLRHSSPRQPTAAAPHTWLPGRQAILDDLWQCSEIQHASDQSYVCRYPLLDRQLFEFLLAIPWSQKHVPLCDRYLQRRALKGLVDDDIRSRIGFGVGSRSFIEGLRRSKQWQDYLCDTPALAAAGLVDADGWRQAIRQACVGQTGAEAVLLRAITVEVWLKQLAEFRPVAPPPQQDEATPRSEAACPVLGR